MRLGGEDLSSFETVNDWSLPNSKQGLIYAAIAQALAFGGETNSLLGQTVKELVYHLIAGDLKDQFPVGGTPGQVPR